MKKYDIRNAVKVFYYLMAIDGDISADEIDCLDEIGTGIDGEDFKLYKEQIIEECQRQIDRKNDDDNYYDVLIEGADEALNNEIDGESKVIPARLLLWNLLAVAFSNNTYDVTEKRMIAHIARVSDVEKDILLEMERLMQTAKAVQREKKFMQTSNYPYVEVNPIMEELNKKLSVILDAGKSLVEDEVELYSLYIYKPNFFDKTKTFIDEKVNLSTHAIKEKAKVTAEAAAKKVDPIVKQAKESTSKLIRKINIKSSIKNTKNEEEK